MELQTLRDNETPPSPAARAVLWQTAMQITELLQRVRAGDQQALNTVIPLVYDELKKTGGGTFTQGR
jgi:hypothetical protein